MTGWKEIFWWTDQSFRWYDSSFVSFFHIYHSDNVDATVVLFSKLSRHYCGDSFVPLSTSVDQFDVAFGMTLHSDVCLERDGLCAVVLKR